ncbi:MAG: RidA family protein [Alphaproteobacteria bacterium]|nr:RidA family protein [Alphaproteobacteria bacterium]
MSDSITPPEMWQPFGAFSMARVQGDGHVLHLKGQIPLDRDGNLVGRGDMRAQVRQTLENIRTLLAHVGGEMGDVLSLTHYATDIDAFMQAGDIRTEFFKAPYPVTTTVQVARLYDPEVMIEITAIAEIPRDRVHAPGPGASSD